MSNSQSEEVFFESRTGFELDFNRRTFSVKTRVGPVSRYGYQPPWGAELVIVSEFDCNAPLHTIPTGAIAAAKDYLTTGQWPPEYNNSQKSQGSPIEQIVRWFGEQQVPVKWRDPSYCTSQ